MKKSFIFLSILALLLAASCAKVETDTDSGAEAARVCVAIERSKVAFGEKTGDVYKLVWQSGDQIAVNEAVSEPLSNSESGKQEASFDVKYYIKTPYNIVYPASVLVDSKVQFPADQTYVPSGADPDAVVMLGRSSSTPISLSNACAYVKVTMAKGGSETLKRVKLYSYDDSPIAGVYTPDYANASLTYAEGGRNYVSVSGSDGIAYNDQDKAEIIFVVPAGTYAKGFAVAATTMDGKQMSKKAYGTSGVTLVAGQMLDMPELTFADDGLPFSGGEGTVANPYKIATSEDIQSLADLCNASESYANYADKAYVQVADIDMNGVEFYPIGSLEGISNPFTGTYDGQNHVIESMHPTTTEKSSALFGTLSGATVKDITFRSATCSGTYPATVAGYLIGGTVSGIKVFGSQITATANVCAGIVGVLREGTVSSCTVDKTSSISGTNYTGGITGSITGNVSGGTSTIENCQCDASVTGVGNVGGICGFTSTDSGTSSKAYITSCISTGNVNATGNNAGGITGYIRAFTEVIIRGCKNYGNVTSTAENAGGVVGYGVAKEELYIDRCAAYGNVTGKCKVGGITGHQVPNGTDADIVIANSLYAGQIIKAVGNINLSGSYYYALAGGIIGYWKNTSGNLRIINNASLAEKIDYPSTYGSKATNVPCVAGLIGLQDGTLGANSYVKGCYSLIQPRGFLVNGDNLIADKALANNATGTYNPSSSQYTAYYGGVYGKCSTALVYQYVYWDNCIWQGPGTLKSTSNFGTFGPLSELCVTLQSFKNSYSGFTLVDWSMDERGYPTPGITSKSIFPQPLRISVIGDSISTYRGWIPVGYAIYYWRNKPDPNGTGKICDVYDKDMYWARLAYELLPYAKIEKNIAWSGSCLTSVDNQTTKPGFITRAGTSGFGAPDVILIHGGTNDYNRNVAGISVPLTSGYGYLDEVPQSVMDELFSKNVSDLDEKCFVDAYIKLVKKIHSDHPNCKIVIVIGDRPTVPMENAMLKIAKKYDYIKAVDFRAAGYNNLPKFSGSHPTKAGHKTMSDKIFADVGQWLIEGTQGSGYGEKGDVTGDSTSSFVTTF